MKASSCCEGENSFNLITIHNFPLIYSYSYTYLSECQSTQVSEEFLIIKTWLLHSTPAKQFPAHVSSFLFASLLSNNNVGQGVNVSGGSLTPAALTNARLRRRVGPPRPGSSSSSWRTTWAGGQDKPVDCSRGWAVGVMQQSRDRAELNLDTSDFFFFHTPWDHHTLLAPLPPPRWAASCKNTCTYYREETLRSVLLHAFNTDSLICKHPFVNCFSFCLFCCNFITLV